MKTIIISNILYLISLSLFSQEIISSAGEHAEITAYQISWTIGEPVISTIEKSENILTQGFHQSKLLVTQVFSFESNLEIIVYPNPATKKVFVKHNSQHVLHYILYGINGEILKRNALNFNTNEIEVEQLSNGTYYLKIFNNTCLERTFKLVKIY